MIIGTHFLVYSEDPVADRKFFRDVLGLRHVDAGEGWLIFALPPSEVAVHPGKPEGHELYLLTDDVHEEIHALAKKGITCSEVKEQSWGLHTVIRVPGGGLLGMYQPKHPLSISAAHQRRGAARPRKKARASRRGRR